MQEVSGQHSQQPQGWGHPASLQGDTQPEIQVTASHKGNRKPWSWHSQPVPSNQLNTTQPAIYKRLLSLFEEQAVPVQLSRVGIRSETDRH